MLTHTAFKNLYQLDYHQWLLSTIEWLRNQQCEQLDYENLCEESVNLTPHTYNLTPNT